MIACERCSCGPAISHREGRGGLENLYDHGASQTPLPSATAPQRYWQPRGSDLSSSSSAREGEETKSEWSGTTITGSGSATDNAEETDWSGDRGWPCLRCRKRPRTPPHRVGTNERDPRERRGGQGSVGGGGAILGVFSIEYRE